MTQGEMPRCSFCMRSGDEVKKLIAGPRGVYICNECVDGAVDVVEEVRLKKTRLLKAWSQRVASDEAPGAHGQVGKSEANAERASASEPV